MRRDEGVDESATLLSGCANDEDASKSGHCQIREKRVDEAVWPWFGRDLFASDLVTWVIACGGKISEELT